eukprot:2161228-Pyramimonas_sp.AAC.1
MGREAHAVALGLAALLTPRASRDVAGQRRAAWNRLLPHLQREHSRAQYFLTGQDLTFRSVSKIYEATIRPSR